MTLVTEQEWERVRNAPSVTVAAAVLLAAGIEPTDELTDLVKAAARGSFLPEEASRAHGELDVAVGREKSTEILAMLRVCKQKAWPGDLGDNCLDTYRDATLYDRGDTAARTGRFEDCHIRPASFADFCLRQGWPIPQGLAAIADMGERGKERPPARSDRFQWVPRAREIAAGLLEQFPHDVSIQKKIAPLVAERLTAEKVVGRGGKPLSASTVYRHALQKLRLR